MTVIVFGNPDLPQDSLPLKLLPELKRRRPDLDIRRLDPNEEWDIPADITVIDTVINLKVPRLFDNLDAFVAGPRLTLHDFDAYANLRLMLKIGRIRTVRVIGLPPTVETTSALNYCLDKL